MTEPSDKALESQLRLAASSRPGSREARHVYGCTCTPNERTENRAIDWTPDAPLGGWVEAITLDCPAHGRLLEHTIQDERAALDEAMDRLLKRAPATESLEEQRRVWNEALASWLPAGGAASPLFGVDRDADTARFTMHRQPRSLRERISDAAWSAYYGFLEGWRGP